MGTGFYNCPHTSELLHSPMLLSFGKQRDKYMYVCVYIYKKLSLLRYKDLPFPMGCVWVQLVSVEIFPKGSIGMIHVKEFQSNELFLFLQGKNWLTWFTHLVQYSSSTSKKPKDHFRSANSLFDGSLKMIVLLPVFYCFYLMQRLVSRH